MKTLGIIAEFNPFHNGHAYMIKEAKKKSGADRVVIVMSGSFVQRGEPAFFDKWTRTRVALLNGADIVLELPVLFAAANAEVFASAAVSILEESGIVDILAFGSESGDLASLQEAAKIMTDETEEFRQLLKANLDSGLSYPAARANALETISHISSEILSQPNHILALEYLKALERSHSSIAPMTVKRVGSKHHDDELKEEYASASAIRKGLLENRVGEAFRHLPESSYEIYTHAISAGMAPVLWKSFEAILNYKLRNIRADELKDIFEVTEGLENRILRSVEECYSVNDIADFIKSKRYTYTKMQRILLHILLDIEKKDVSYYMKRPHLPYIRVLGFRKDSSEILGDLVMQAKCPVLTNLKKAKDILDDNGLRLLAIEKKATDLYTMAAPNAVYRGPDQDFTNPLVIL